MAVALKNVKKLIKTLVHPQYHPAIDRVENLDKLTGVCEVIACLEPVEPIEVRPVVVVVKDE
jgi:hypothetical protein